MSITTTPIGDPPMHACWCSLPYERCCGAFRTAPERGHIEIIPAPPHGCVCPVGAEATCQGSFCPRKATVRIAQI